MSEEPIVPDHPMLRKEKHEKPDMGLRVALLVVLVLLYLSVTLV